MVIDQGCWINTQMKKWSAETRRFGLQNQSAVEPVENSGVICRFSADFSVLFLKSRTRTKSRKICEFSAENLQFSRQFFWSPEFGFQSRKIYRFSADFPVIFLWFFCTQTWEQNQKNLQKICRFHPHFCRFPQKFSAKVAIYSNFEFRPKFWVNFVNRIGSYLIASEDTLRSQLPSRTIYQSLRLDETNKMVSQLSHSNVLVKSNVRKTKILSDSNHWFAFNTIFFV